MPISMISLVDDKRQWFKSISGWNKKETPRDEAFCAHAILNDDLFIIPDATKDLRFHDNPLVVQDPQVKFYAGAPLINKDGNAIGTLCVLDTKQRELSVEQKDAMKMLSRQVMAQLELRLRNIELGRLMEEFKNAQHQLIIQEKMASLGQLTTGIAHEIKNPLNFINNFAMLSNELINEFSGLFISLDSKFSKEEFENSKEILLDLTTNITKIEEHGKRADNIVNSMLLHSPKSKGEFKKTDLNRILMDYANLSLSEHNLKNSGMIFTVEYDLDKNVKDVDLIPQDFSRVIINMVNNATQALKKKYETVLNGKPTIKISSEGINGFVRIGIYDNGIGIREEILKNIYTPFFTTKPSGEGTGLGLSISYDIIVKYHNGKLTVNSIEGEYTKFEILIPVIHSAN